MTGVLGCWGALRLYNNSLGVFHHDDTAGAKKGIVTVGNNLFLAEMLCRSNKRPMHNATFPI